MREGSVSVPKIALSREEAAEALSVSLATFERAIQPELSVVRVGSRRLIPTAELERWVEQHSTPPAVEEVARDDG